MLQLTPYHFTSFKFLVLFDCSGLGSFAVGFVLWFGTGNWKSVVWFAFVSGVHHCFKLIVITQMSRMLGRLGNQILHGQKHSKFSPGKRQYPGFNRSAVYFVSDLLKKSWIRGIDDLVDKSFFLLAIHEALRISTAAYSVVFKNCMSRS